jgi:predicted proteasome-type protease/co-chaperonin GroES (HSP10)
MAKINTYPTTTPESSDLILGSDVNSSNATKNFLVSALQAFIQGNTDLQTVLNAGNTSTGAMILDGSLRINSGLLDSSGGLGTSGQALLSTGTSVSWGEPTTANVSLPVRFAQAVSKGDPVYVSGYNSGQARIEVAKSEANDNGTMPSIGLADANYSINTNGSVITIGNLADIDLSTLSPAPLVGDIVYVKDNGGLTSVAPIGDSLIQNVGIVSRNSGSNGAIEVSATGRANALPNITAGRILYGQSTGQATESNLLRYSEENVVQGTPSTTFTGETRINTPLLKATAITTAADNTVALAAGLVTGDIYKTATGELRIVL